jgi:hypothetical protein
MGKLFEVKVAVTEKSGRLRRIGLLRSRLVVAKEQNSNFRVKKCGIEK